MKKLLVAAIGVATAVGAFADQISQQRFKEVATGSVAKENLASVLNSAADPAGTYWSDPADITNEYTVSAVTLSKPGSIDGVPGQALDIKTKFGKPLSLNIISGGTATNIPSSGLYFDSLVKFTVCDSEPDQEYTGAKIIMWLQETDTEPAQTNLYVRAGYLSMSGDGVVSTPTNYVCAMPENAIDINGLNRVTIKAIADITSTGRGVPGFAIYINRADGAPATSDINSLAAKWDSSFPADELTEAAEKLNDGSALFPSLDVTSGTKASLASVAFDGTGSITDIRFTDVAPTYAGDMATDKASVVDDQGNAVEGSPFTSLEDAVTAVNNLSSGTYTFALTKGLVLDGTLAFNSSANIILDFAGFVLTNTSASVAAISNAGQLTLTNSTIDVGGIYCAAAGAAVSQLDVATSLAIAGGNFWGDIVAVDLAGETITISGGAFKQQGLDLDELGVQIADGKKISETQNGDGLYEVVIDGVASVGGTEYLTLKEAVDAATAGQTVTVLKDCEVTEPITFSVGIVVSNDCTVTLSASYALRFANGTVSPVTFCGTGAFEQPSGALGSPILIGNNENKSSYGMADTFTGSLVLNSGNITILHAKNNVIKVEAGSFVMNGGNVSGGKCGVKADSEHGDATTTVTINGGVVNNLTAAVATVVDGSGSATVTIAGGEITGPFSKGANTTLTIPGTSTAKFERDQTAYCEAGYKTVQSGDWYVVTAKVYYTAVSLNKETTSIETNLTETLTATFTPASAADDTYTWASSAPAIATVDQNGVVTAVAAGEATITVTATHDSSVTASCTVTVTATSVGPAPLDPSGDKEETVVEAASSEAAIQAVTITPPAGSGAQTGDYKSLFTYSATPAGDGQYTVTITGIQESVKQDVATDAAKVLDGTSSTVTVPAGLYYKVTTMTNLDGTGTTTIVGEGLSTGTDVNVSKPGTTQGFIKVEMGTKAID